MAAMPHSPDKVKDVAEIGKIKVDQVCIGSCTNASYVDLMKVAKILKGKTVHPNVSVSVSPGSKQVLNMLAKNKKAVFSNKFIENFDNFIEFLDMNYVSVLKSGDLSPAKLRELSLIHIY